MFKTIDVRCDSCITFYIHTTDVPSGASLPDEVLCDFCGGIAKRLISCNIAKIQIEEIVHGGVNMGGKIVRRDTGMKDVVVQAALTRRLKKAKKAGDSDVAREVQKELDSKRQETIKKL